jgi:hypothetical protein
MRPLVRAVRSRIFHSTFHPLASSKRAEQSLAAHSDEKARAAARKFIPSSQNVYGVRVPILNELALKHKAGGGPVIHASDPGDGCP